jgi:signal transduction histidine kinase
VTVAEDRANIDAYERRSRLLVLAVAAFLLVAGTALSLLVRLPGEHVWTPNVGIVGLAALAGAWLWGMNRVPAGMPVSRAMSYVGLLALMALMVHRHPLFGFFAFSGYLFMDRLPKRAWPVGVAATAFMVGSSQVGGLPPPTYISPVIYVGVIAVNLFAAGAMMAGSVAYEAQHERRKQMVAELSGANRKLEAAMAENAGLHALLLTQAREAGVLDERQRLAREIHDTLAQGLTGIITQLAAADATSAAERQRHLETAAQLARESLSEARRSVQALRPGSLEAAQLPDALAGVVDRWSEVNGVPVEAVTTGAARPVHPEVEVTLLRTAQEALANVAKHAKASRVGVTLSYMEDLVTLDVRDDGVGFDVDRPPGGTDGYGLTAMRQRLGLVAGELDVESEPGAGTAVSARVPVG